MTSTFCDLGGIYVYWENNNKIKGQYSHILLTRVQMWMDSMFVTLLSIGPDTMLIKLLD